jgi:hypothetical protein
LKFERVQQDDPTVLPLVKITFNAKIGKNGKNGKNGKT